MSNTTETPPRSTKVIKVAASNGTVGLGHLISTSLLKGDVDLQTVGAGATHQAVKGIAAASQALARDHGLVAVTEVRFETAEGYSRPVSLLVFHVTTKELP